jgi:predicted RNase H-like nuclease (RuvC/YqgF family)
MQFGLDPEAFMDCKTMDQVAYILHAQIGSRGHQESTQASTPRKKKPMSIRELYRKLASILHPDKEHDPEVRAEKTELMKKLNNAYRDNDIETMMNMQVELTQSDIGDLVNDREVLNLTIEHLNRQIAKLKREADDFLGQLSHIRGIKKIKKMEDVEATIDDMIHDQLSSLQVHQMALENEIKFCFIYIFAYSPSIPFSF